MLTSAFKTPSSYSGMEGGLQQIRCHHKYKETEPNYGLGLELVREVWEYSTSQQYAEFKFVPGTFLKLHILQNLCHVQRYIKL